MEDERPPRYRGLMPAWQPGQSGNPKGRPKGSRNKLAEVFLSEMHADFREHGKEAIARARQENPALYLSAISSLFGKAEGEEIQAASA